MGGTPVVGSMPQRRVAALLTLAAFAGLLAALLFLLSLAAKDSPAPDLQEIGKTFIVPAEVFKPEPVERLLFVVGTIAAPFLIFFCYRMVLPLVSAMKPRTLSLLDPLLLLIACGAVIGVVSYAHLDFPYAAASPPGAEKTVAAGALAGALALAWLMTGSDERGARGRWARGLGLVAHLIAVGLILLSFLLSIFSLDAVNGNWCFTVSFNAVFHAVAHVFNGKELLVDLSHQYGLYPHFLLPFFRLTGLSVLGFTVAMGTLTAAAYGCIYLVLRRTVASRLIAGLCCSGMIFANYLLMRTVALEFYFQYHPLRTIFPAISIVLTYRYFSRRSRALYYLCFVVYAIAMLWNFETGFVVFVSWLLVLWYDELPTRRPWPLLAHLGRGVAVGGAVLAAFTLSMLAAYGHAPDYAGFFRFQWFFYGLGYLMLPMPRIGFWIPVILLYVVALIASAEALFRGTRTALSRLLFFVAVLGVGLFSYYQGRSVDPALLCVFYPSAIVLAVLTDRLVQGITRDKSLFNYLPVTMSVFSMLFALGWLAVTYKPLLARLSATLPRIVIPLAASLRHQDAAQVDLELAKTPALRGTPAYLRETIGLVRANTRPGEEVLILSGHSGIYHLCSGTTSPLRLPGPSEWFLAEELNTVKNYLMRGNWEKVFIDESYTWTENRGLAELDAMIRSRFVRAAAGPDGAFRMYVRRRS